MAVTVPGFRSWTERAVALARGVLRRAARRLPRGRLLAAPPARREPGDPRGAGRACRRASRATRWAATSRRGCATSSAPPSRPRRGAAGDPRRARLVDRRGGRAGAACPRWRATSTPTWWSSAAATPGMWTAWEMPRPSRTRASSCSRPTAAGWGRAGATAASSPRCGCTCPLLRGSTARRRARELCEASVESVAGDRRVVRGPGGRRVAPRGAAPRRLLRARARTARAPARSTATNVVALTRRARRARSATRPCSAAGSRRAPARPSTRRGWPSGCASGCSGAGCGSSRARPCGRCTPTGASEAPGAVVAETAGGRVRAARGGRSRSTPRSGRLHAAAQPPHGLLEPHRADRAGAGRDRGARLDRRRGDHRRPRAAALLPHHARRAHPVRLGRRADGGGRAHARAHGRRPGRSWPQTRRSLLRIFPALAGRRDRRTPGAGRSTSPPPTCRRS